MRGGLRGRVDVPWVVSLQHEGSTPIHPLPKISLDCCNLICSLKRCR